MFQTEDFKELEEKLTNLSLKSRNKIAKEEASGMVRIAFDMFKNNTDNTVWQLVSENNNEYFVRVGYDDEPISDSNWTVTSDQQRGKVVLAYNGYPLYCFTSSRCGFNQMNIDGFKTFILKKAKEEKDFRRELISSLSEAHRNMIIDKFPELND